MKLKKHHLEYIFFAVPLLLAMICIISVTINNHQAMLAIPMPQELIGEYSYDGENWQPLTENADLSALKGDLFLRGTFLREMGEDWLLNFYLNHIGVVIKINGDTPFEGGAGNAKILKTGLQEVVYHFFSSGFGYDKFRVCFDVLHQLILIFAHLEEIRFLMLTNERTAAIGANAAFCLCIGEEGFAGNAIPAFIAALVDIALIVKTLEDLLYSFFVIVVCGADKVVILAAEHIPDIFDLFGNTVYIFLRSDACFISKCFDLLTVFVCTCAEEYVIAERFFVACDGIGENDLVSIADVGLSRCVSDRCGDIKLSFVFHGCIYPFMRKMRMGILRYFSKRSIFLPAQ